MYLEVSIENLRLRGGSFTSLCKKDIDRGGLTETESNPDDSELLSLKFEKQATISV